MKDTIAHIFNYFFPSEAYEGSKITDTKWFQKLTPIAPYTVALIAVFILIWGIISPNTTRFFLKPQFIALLSITFWITFIAVIVKIMRKKRRDPAFFLLIASFIAVRGLFALMMFSAVNPIIQKAKVQIESKKQEISKEVSEKLKSHKSSFDDHSATLQARSQAIQTRVDKAFSELNSRMESRLDRFKRRERENDAAFWKIVAENREKNKEFDKLFWKSSEKFQQRIDQRKREWCRTHTLSQMCKNLPPDPNAVETVKKEETNGPDNTTYIDLPLFFKYEIKE